MAETSDGGGDQDQEAWDPRQESEPRNDHFK